MYIVVVAFVARYPLRLRKGLEHISSRGKVALFVIARKYSSYMRAASTLLTVG